MTERRKLIEYCMKYGGVYEDYPFDDPNWTLMRHTANKLTFAFIYERNDRLCLNLKCEPSLAFFLRRQYTDIIPGYHTNKEHWNTVLPDGDVPDNEVYKLIDLSYDLTKPKEAKK